MADLCRIGDQVPMGGPSVRYSRRRVHLGDTARTHESVVLRRLGDDERHGVAVAEVSVRYWAGARAAAGVDEEPLVAASTADVVDTLTARGGELARVVALSSLLVDGQVVRDRLPLTDGQVVEVLPPFAGG